MTMKRSITIIALFLPLLLWAKNPTVSGYVTDVQTGERLIGATVQDMRSGVGTVTNVNGFYSLTIPSDTIQLQAGYVGYDRTLSEAFMLDADTLVEMMLVSATVLEEVVVEAGHSVSGTHSVQMSASRFPFRKSRASLLSEAKWMCLRQFSYCPVSSLGRKVLPDCMFVAEDRMRT